jgi:formylglycine-generating enzyme required for sulfatase activity
MKNKLPILLLAIALFIGIFKAGSQTIAVKSFRKIESDQEARISSPKTDLNGKKCAIIKVVTSQTGFVFDFGLIGNAVATEQKTGEIWVWMPAGARKVTISHQQLGVLRNYPFDIDIEEATVYEMVLTTGKVVTTVEEQIVSQWLVINSTPTGSDIYIDDQPANQTPYQSELPLGKHTYRISHDMYLPTAGTVVLTTEKKEILNPVLKPDFGTLNITTSPESDAVVAIDGVAIGKNTPCTIEKIKSGEHIVTVRLNMYKTATEKINMQAGGNIKLPVDLIPTFADITIVTNPASDIYIAGERKGTGTWIGRLLPGVYLFEARKDRYTTASEKHEVITGQPINLTLQPIAKNGMLKIMTTPTDAVITLDGVNKGTAPATLRNLLVGDYTLILSLPNYATITKPIHITEGQTTEVNETLASSTAITIKGEPTDAQLFVDNQLVNSTVSTAQLSYGSHVLRLQKGNEKLEKHIEVKQDGETSFSLLLNSYLTETIADITKDMILIDGGTFQMGSNDGGGIEKPVHSVTLNSFYMGKYEVTQALWEVIMGNNPCYYKGDNLPVESVSWDDVQTFLRKLNAKTGKVYRLPTEAEWEYAARGGSKSQGFKYAGSNNLDDVAWCGENSNNTTHAVGSKQPNELGLYDMSGNVWEWCNDFFDSDYYANSPQANPKGPATGSERVNRGGGWYADPQYCRVADRSVSPSSRHEDFLGFRIVLSAK